jgi:hypothetical protein
MAKCFTYKGLLVSLAKYVEPGDLRLSRDVFLRKVLERIVNDLASSITVDSPHSS